MGTSVTSCCGPAPSQNKNQQETAPSLPLTADEIRSAVRDRYGRIAVGDAVLNDAGGCCPSADRVSLALGYSEEQLAAVPGGANLGLGCGNPQAIAAIQPGETVVDLGSGAGFDCFLAAAQTGTTGRVIGIDMTPDMVSKARANARQTHATNVEFRLGEIEHLPVADQSADVILSNCVINLSPDKESVFREAFRVLKPGGRLAISDVVAIADIPESLLRELTAITGCISGAARVDVIEGHLKSAGFQSIAVTVKKESRDLIRAWWPDSGIEDLVASATIEAVKPGGSPCCAPTCC